MATQAFTGKMLDRKEPDFISFGRGDFAEGILLEIERISIKGKSAVRYTVEKPDGELVSFLGTYQLDTKLRAPRDLNHWVCIVCEGEDATKGQQGNAMKLFKVKVSEKAVMKNPQGLYVTDDDIPNF